jgi:acetate kinase
MKILSVNCGSSSLKFQMYEMPEEKVLISGYVEKIGQPDCFWTVKVNGEKIKSSRPLANHTEAVDVLIEELFKHNIVKSLDEIERIGHRVLHGGEFFKESAIVTDEVIEKIKSLIPLGPLHLPGNLAGIEAFRKVLPNVPMVAVFDTAFHQTMPKRNYIYPVPLSWYEKYGVRKYGFHGTSHKYITEVMKQELGKENVNLIVCHIGSGASIAAVKDGKCYNTTMGITPLDGLMMGTRSGAIDPSILEYVCKEANMSVEEVTNVLNKQSGFLGVAGQADCRDVEALIEEGNENAKLAYAMYCDRIAKYIAEYYLELNGKVDSIIFTAGVGENGAGVRKEVLDRLNPIGIYVDEEMNNKIASFKDIHEGVISTKDSKVEVRVLPTDEEIMIVRDTYNLTK